MNIQNKTNNAPVVETSAAILFFFNQIRGGTIQNYNDALLSVSHIAPCESMKAAVDLLLTEGSNVERAIEGFIKTRMPRLPLRGHGEIDFFSTVSSNIENCPLHSIIKVISGLCELSPQGSDPEQSWPSVSEEDFKLELSLEDRIRRFEQDFECFLGKLASDDFTQYDYGKELRELLTEAETTEFEPITGSLKIEDDEFALILDSAAIARFHSTQVDLKDIDSTSQPKVNGRVILLFWAALSDEERERFPTPHHFWGFFNDRHVNSPKPIHPPLEWVKQVQERATKAA